MSTVIGKLTKSFQKSDLILIAGRPSIGKTALALDISECVLSQNNKSIMYFSLEMSEKQLINRIIQRTNSDYSTPEGIREQSRFIIDDSVGISVEAVRQRCRKQMQDGGIDLIIIDYLQLISSEDNRQNIGRIKEVEYISSTLKQIAQEVDVPVIIISQLSKKVEERPDKHPLLSDLRESGIIEKYADTVMFIYRDGYYHLDKEKKDAAELIIAKQKSGNPGIIKLKWDAEKVRFTDFE